MFNIEILALPLPLTYCIKKGITSVCATELRTLSAVLESYVWNRLNLVRDLQ